MTKTKNNYLWYTSLILSAIGGINWGLVGAFKINLVEKVFAAPSLAGDLIYISIGASGLYLLYGIMAELIND